MLERVAKIIKLSGVNIEPVATRHMTLWAAKDDQASFHRHQEDRSFWRANAANRCAPGWTNGRPISSC